MKIRIHNKLTAAALAALPMLLTAGASAQELGPAPAIVAPGRPVVVAPVLAAKIIWASGLQAPHGIARDSSGNVYVAEFRGGRISKFSPEGKPLAKIGVDLKNPAWIERAGGIFYISERKANRLLRMDKKGTLMPVGVAVEEPLGLTMYKGGLVVVAHTTSRVWRFEGDALKPTVGSTGAAPKLMFGTPEEGAKRYGYRCVAVDKDGTMFITDEVEGQLLLITTSGRAAAWVRDLDDPTAVVISPKGEVFVAEEGAGRISRVAADGSLTVIADGLGKPRDIEFIDDRTMLVTDQGGGNVWRVTIP